MNAPVKNTVANRLSPINGKTLFSSIPASIAFPSNTVIPIKYFVM